MIQGSLCNDTVQKNSCVDLSSMSVREDLLFVGSNNCVYGAQVFDDVR